MAKFPGSALRSRRKIDISPVVVIGLGRFGSSLARELTRYGVEVLGIDADDKLVRDHAADLTDTAAADATDVEALRQLGVDEVERVVLAIGSHLEASILTASNLVELGIRDIWAKADSDPHARILTQIGVHHVVRPEHDTGRRIAHLLGGRFQDFAELDENYGVIKLAPPSVLLFGTLDVQRIWEKYHVYLVSVRTGTGRWEPLSSGYPLSSTDLIVVAGSPEDLEVFSCA